MNQKQVAVMVGVFALATWPVSPQKYDWAKAEREIRRIPPSAFKELPRDVVEQLAAKGCEIPQTFEAGESHNIVRGQFSRQGQRDWGVLCSKGGESTILLFWEKPPKCPSELGTAKDLHSLQDIGEGQVGYSRRIAPADPAYIAEHYKRYGGFKPPPLTHQGIEDVFVGKASVIHYCHRGEWLRLTGFD